MSDLKIFRETMDELADELSENAFASAAAQKPSKDHGHRPPVSSDRGREAYDSLDDILDESLNKDNLQYGEPSEVYYSLDDVPHE